MRRTVLIVAAGEPPPADLLRGQAARCDAVYACDSAVETVLASGVRPDVVVGDMDSITFDLPPDMERLPLAEQETTDLEKACYTAVERGFGAAVVLGAGGLRWDHVHANLGIFARYADRLDLEAGDEHGWLTMLPAGDWCPILAPHGTVVSLLPLPTAEGVTTRGLRWPLRDATLAIGGRGGCSNEVASDDAAVRYMAGRMARYLPAQGT